MSVLVDRQIHQRLTERPSLATGIPTDDYVGPDSKIQAASINLTIGDIYLPGTEDNKSGGINNPLSNCTLHQGHTAVIRTKEVLDLGPDLAGIGFPPATVSLRTQRSSGGRGKSRGRS
jgi:hypothetical protein